MRSWLARQLDGLKSVASSLLKSAKGGVFWAGTLWQTKSFSRTKAVYDALYWSQKYDENSYLQSPLRRVCEDFAAVKWSLKRRFVGPTGRVQREDVLDHDAIRIWEQPNPRMTGFEFRELGMRCLELCGRFLVYIEFDDRGYPRHLWPVAPHRIEDIPRLGQPNFVFTLDDGDRKDVGPEHVIFLTYKSAVDPYGFGVGRAVAVTRAIALTENADDWSLNLYRNGSHVGAIVDIPDVPLEDQKAIQKHFDKNHTGLENAHKTLFVSSSSGPGNSSVKSMQVAKLGATHRELDHTASKKNLKDDIRENWHVPPELVGDSKNSNRATVSAAETLEASGNTRPRCVRWCAWWNVYYIPMWGDTDLELCFENPVKEEAEFRHKSLLEGARNGLCRPNEWREDRGLDPYSGVLGESTYLPLNMQIVDPNSAEVPALPPTPEQQASDQADEAIDQAAKCLALLEAVCLC